MESNIFNDRNYYKYLNIDRNDNPDAVTAAYEGMMNKYYPDIYTGSKEAEEKAKQLKEAYKVLSDPVKRKEYNKWLDSNEEKETAVLYSKEGKQAGDSTNQSSDSSGNAQRTFHNTQGYRIDFASIRNQVFNSYDDWRNAKRETQERKAKRRKRVALTFVVLFLIAVVGFGYFCRDHLTHWISDKIPGHTSKAQAVLSIEDIELPDDQKQEAEKVI